ncbi:hypothetical protein L6452_13557 [Arctium lappa]|uniref:Uncharacterized protein n=1 Tax=Arctium lappa TaxID=4217 RepID=A0ACB9CIJ8_ARCLA|nr:hypothetical protein L6452_13557 [Arctium lappa]
MTVHYKGCEISEQQIYPFHTRIVVNILAEGHVSIIHDVQVFKENVQPLLPPVQLSKISEELKGYDGNNPKKPLLMAIKGQIYYDSQNMYIL